MILLRVFLLLLIFSNLVFYFWGQGMLGGQSAPGEPERLANQIEPEKISIVSQTPAPAQPKAAPEPPAPAAASAPAPKPEPQPKQEAKAETPPPKPAASDNACVAISGFGREQARMVISKFRPDANGIKMVTRSIGDPDSFWVMYPELQSRALAERKAAELRSLGVTDLFIMGEDTTHPNAISLGLFKSREKADEHLDSLKKKGVRSARIVLREAANARHVVEVTGPREAVNARVSQVLAAYRGTERGKCGAGE